MSDTDLRQELVAYGRSLFERGYSCGTSGNLSVRHNGGGYLVTPTNISLGRLDAQEMSRLDESGKLLDGPPPTKEVWLHLAVYRSRPNARAIVHLHSTYSVALSCLAGHDPDDMLPPITPYVVMRVGRLALIPYGRPGDSSLSEEISRRALRHHALLLANHGPVVAGADLASAVAITEELEETARLAFLLHGREHRVLNADQVEELRRVFGS